ncbi:CD109 antigen [Lamellibrachia satsuma]|nr:CD109 antigen [Lamellibrachia satsuma]
MGSTSPQGDIRAIGSTGPLCGMGATGSTGPQGGMATTGSNGLQGGMGTTGPQGGIDAIGSTGPLSGMGATGSTGPQGGMDTTGSNDAQAGMGSTGPQGGIGATGSTGPQCGMGTTGSNGPEAGIGSTGPYGGIGATGSTGPQGGMGATSSSGPQTGMGTTGSNGPQAGMGSTGPYGGIGATGSTGPQGGIGATGSTGPQCGMGTTDSNGPQADMGSTGPYGGIGATGSNGPQAGMGSTGPYGGIGATGSTGSQGGMGATSSTGPLGDVNATDSTRRTDVNTAPVGRVQKPRRLRCEFPETWLWLDTIMGENGETTLEVTAPDTITSWVATAFAMHREGGLGITPTASKLMVFQPFIVSLNLPYSIIRGEEFALQAMVFNYLPQAVEVKVILNRSDSFGVCSVNDLTHAVSKEDIVWITIPPNEAESAWFWIVPDQLGNIPIEVKAQSHLAADAVQRMLLVEPEGTPQEYHKSIVVDFSKEAGSLLETVNITFPPDLVEGSEYIKVTAIGDLMGTSIQGLGSLLQMPYGCGEQNMINFAPAIYIMDYLKATNQLTPEVKAKVLKIMESGYMRELTYQHTDGSFSAFGNWDRSGSMWLTAFVAKCFHQAMPYIYIDADLIGKILGWITDRQNHDGSFSEFGHVHDTFMQGGSSRGVPLTAYVLSTLVENKDISGSLKKTVSRAIAAAVANLETALDTESFDSYTLAIVTYALTISNSSKAANALDKLNAIVINMENTKHWEESKSVKYPAEEMEPYWRRPYRQARVFDIEMTAYGLLAYTANKDLFRGIPILKWLAKQRNPHGGFSATQDTVLALQAMAELSAMAFSGDSLRLDVSLDSGDVHYKYETITKANAGILQSKQVAVSYNVINADNRAGVLVNIDTKDKGNGTTKITVCGKYTKKEASGMTVMEVGLISGNEADTDELVKQVPTLKLVETKERKVILYFDEFTERDTCVEFLSQQVIPLIHPQKARVEGYQYYSPDVKDTKYYMPAALEQTDMCSACPACCVYDNTTAISSSETTSADNNAVTEQSDDLKYEYVRDSGCVMSYTTAVWLVVIVCCFLYS